ncbi:MAG TPA: DUF2007 domain-containing protein [Rhizomicrobium sp.]|jgi:hypothetical protein|nr:DUF2007 domain-containing protein [Rhizomicrobium sp.]
MRVLLKTNNPVQLNFAQTLLRDAGIDTLVFDEQMSVMEGSIGILPRRLMVGEGDFAAARNILREQIPDATIEK